MYFYENEPRFEYWCPSTKFGRFSIYTNINGEIVRIYTAQNNHVIAITVGNINNSHMVYTINITKTQFIKVPCAIPGISINTEIEILSKAAISELLKKDLNTGAELEWGYFSIEPPSYAGESNNVYYNEGYNNGSRKRKGRSTRFQLTPTSRTAAYTS